MEKENGNIFIGKVLIVKFDFDWERPKESNEKLQAAIVDAVERCRKSDEPIHVIIDLTGFTLLISKILGTLARTLQESNVASLSLYGLGDAVRKTAMLSGLLSLSEDGHSFIGDDVGKLRVCKTLEDIIKNILT